MPKFTKQQLEEQYNKLPPVLKDALFSAEIANKMFEVGKRNSLTIEEIGLVAEETGHIILGLTRPEDFGREIETRLNTDEEEAQKITREVNKEVFFPLREALKAAHQMEITEPTTNDQRPTTETEPIAATMAKPMPLSKVEMPSMPQPPTPQQPPKPAVTAPFSPKATITPPMQPKPEPVFPPRPRVTPTAPLPPKTQLPAKPAEPIKPPVAQPKIPPIDLRRSKPERMREAIFAPPVEPQEATTAKEAPPAAKQPAMEPKQTEKKAPYGGYDPYKESVE